MSLPPATVVVVSRGRPGALVACVAALGRQDHPAAEVVAVTDPAGAAALAGSPARVVPFDLPNIAAARNAGLGAAQGEAVAFCDDDALAPPGWLSALCEALSRAPAATGPVREPGRTIGPREILLDGTSREAAPAALLRPRPEADPPAMPRAEGASMAFRAETLRGLGGFDEAFRFYHDETDLFWRLGEAGHATAFVPGAVLDHGLHASDRRRRDRVALTLREVGASVAIWARRRGLDPAPMLAAERAGRRRTLLRQMVAGRLEPRDVARLMADFDLGAAQGRVRVLPRLGARAAASASAKS